jgi:hypothetical protein
VVASGCGVRGGREHRGPARRMDVKKIVNRALQHPPSSVLRSILLKKASYIELYALICLRYVRTIFYHTLPCLFNKKTVVHIVYFISRNKTSFSDKQNELKNPMVFGKVPAQVSCWF